MKSFIKMKDLKKKETKEEEDTFILYVLRHNENLPPSTFTAYVNQCIYKTA